MKDAARKLIHGEDHEILGGGRSQGHPPRYGGTPGGYRVEGRVGRPVRLILGGEGRLGFRATESSVYRASNLDVCKTNEGATPNDSHAPVLGSARHLWIGPTGQILAGLEDVKRCQPIRRRGRGFSLKRQGRIMGHQVAEQEQGDSEDGMERCRVFRNQTEAAKREN